MKILFNLSHLPTFHAKSLAERPFGGTTGGVIHLAEALDKLGQEVVVLTLMENPPSSKPLYWPIKKYSSLGPVDALISVRGWQGILWPIEAKKKFYWTGNVYTSSNTYGLGDLRVIERLDAFLPKSEWQAKAICEASGFPLQKTHVLSNGVHMQDFSGSEERSRKRLIYASTPSRGLQFLPYIFSELKKKHPELELYIYSSFDRYSNVWPVPEIDVDKWYVKTLDGLKKLAGCHVYPSILQKDLAREFMKSTILAYPNQVLESCCNTTLQAQAGGCAIVTSDLASLPETVGKAGLLIRGTPGKGTYLQKFVDACDRILSDEVFFQELSKNAIDQTKDLDWSTIAQKFLNYLKNSHGLS